MAGNYKYSGARLRIDSASAAGILSGAPTVQEGFFGVALTSPASGAAFTLAIQGVWNIPVPASTAKGELLYAPASAGGVLLTESATLTLTRTSSNANAPVLVALTDRDAAGNSDCMILPRAASRSGTQV